MTAPAPAAMTDAMREALHAAVSEILEVNAFELAEPGDAAAAPDLAIGASLTFRGPVAGTLRLWIEPSEARAYAAASLGLDDVEPAVIADAVAELANMIAGHVLSRTWSEVCIALDHAVIGAPDPGVTTPVVVMGEHGRIGVDLVVHAGSPPP